MGVYKTAAAKLTNNVLMVAILITVIVPAWAEEATDRAEIQALFDRVRAAFDQRNAAGVVATAVPEGTLRLLDGTILTPDQWQAMASQDFATMEKMKTVFTTESMEIKGDNAVVLYRETHDYVLIKEKDHKYQGTSRWRAILIRTTMGWRFKDLVLLSASTTRDGQPFVPEAGPEKTN